MRKRRLLFAALIALLVVAGLLVNAIWSPSLSAYGACRRVMAKTEGYGVWRFQNTNPANIEQATSGAVMFSDGYNEAGCAVRRHGSLWVVTGFGSTAVGCALGLADSSGNGGDECPRGRFGVTP